MASESTLPSGARRNNAIALHRIPFLMTAPLILTLSCNDRPGIVARVTGFLADLGANILEAQQFDDTATGRFFMRAGSR